MAEGIAKTLLPDDRIESAGLAVFGGSQVAENAVEAMREIGIDIADHQPRQLTLQMAESADYLVPMTNEHKAALLSAGIPAEKILSFAESVADPYGMDLAAYRACRDQLQRLIKEMVEQVK